MKSIKLLRAAYVNGLLRMPHEGVVHIEDDAEADRVIENGSAEDVSADFTAKQLKDVVGESMATDTHAAAASVTLAPGHEHQETTQAPALAPIPPAAAAPAAAPVPEAPAVVA
ncbi:MAG: hypothetical protein ACRYG4_06825 [Janthinobacterium lividum]